MKIMLIFTFFFFWGFKICLQQERCFYKQIIELLFNEELCCPLTLRSELVSLPPNCCLSLVRLSPSFSLHGCDKTPEDTDSENDRFLLAQSPWSPDSIAGGWGALSEAVHHGRAKPPTSWWPEAERTSWHPPKASPSLPPTKPRHHSTWTHGAFVIWSPLSHTRSWRSGFYGNASYVNHLC